MLSENVAMADRFAATPRQSVAYNYCVRVLPGNAMIELITLQLIDET